MRHTPYIHTQNTKRSVIRLSSFHLSGKGDSVLLYTSNPLILSPSHTTRPATETDSRQPRPPGTCGHATLLILGCYTRARTIFHCSNTYKRVSPARNASEKSASHRVAMQLKRRNVVCTYSISHLRLELVFCLLARRLNLNGEYSTVQ
jgi:hypothetical protein